MEIIKEDNGRRGNFKAMEGEVQAGLMTFKWENESTFNINHTEVNPDFGGQGIGKKLVMAAVEFARENQFKILATCPFAKAVLEKDERLSDVRA